MDHSEHKMSYIIHKWDSKFGVTSLTFINKTLMLSLQIFN